MGGGWREGDGKCVEGGRWEVGRGRVTFSFHVSEFSCVGRPTATSCFLCTPCSPQTISSVCFEREQYMVQSCHTSLVYS